MIDTMKRFGIIIVATLGIWFSVAMIEVITDSNELRTAAAILAFLTTLAIWLVLSFDQIGKIPATTPRTKAKRDAASAASSEDARAALLLSLLTPEEREALKVRLAQELRGDGEAVTLAELLAEQEAMRYHQPR